MPLTLTDNDLLDMELRNRGNDDVTKLIDAVKALKSKIFTPAERALEDSVQADFRSEVDRLNSK